MDKEHSKNLGSREELVEELLARFQGPVPGMRLEIYHVVLVVLRKDIRYLLENTAL